MKREKYKKFKKIKITNKLKMKIYGLTLKRIKIRDNFINKNFKELDWDFFMITVMLLALLLWLDLITLDLINL